MLKSYLLSMLGEKEEILLIARKHWLVLLQHILPEIITSILIVVLTSVIWLVWLPNPLIPLLYLILIFPLISLIRDVAIWSNHQYIITNHRVIQIMGVFSKNVIDSSLEKVNDVKMEQSFLGRFFSYGDIEILTASEIGVNRFTSIGNPVLFKTTMLDAKEREEHPIAIEVKSPSATVTELILQLDQLRKQNIISEEEFQKKKTEMLLKL